MRDARFPPMASIFCMDVAETSLRVKTLSSKTPKPQWGTYVGKGLSSEVKNSQLKCTDSQTQIVSKIGNRFS